MIAAAMASSAATTAPNRLEWRKKMQKNRLPKRGCFTVTHPSETWQEVPCVTGATAPFAPAAAPRGMSPFTIGGGYGGYTADTTSPMTWAEGSFPLVTGVTGVDNYSLQLNSNLFQNSVCTGNCEAWEQFIYSPTQGPGGSSVLFAQYWLWYYLDSHPSCPQGWTTFQNSCHAESFLLPIPRQPITNLAKMTISVLVTGSGINFYMSVGDNVVYAVADNDFLTLAPNWTGAEFNVVGDGGNGRTATLQGSNITMVAQLLTNTTPSSGAPTCDGPMLTAERNNLNAWACCPFSVGTESGIQVTQGSAASGQGAQCPMVAGIPAAGYPQGLTCGIGYIVPWFTSFTGACNGTVTVTAHPYTITRGNASGYTNVAVGDRGQSTNFGFYAQALTSSTGTVSRPDWLLLPRGTACGFTEHCNNNPKQTCMGMDPQTQCPAGWLPKWGGDSSAPSGCGFVWCEYQDPHNVCPEGSSCAFNDQPSGIACGITNHANPDGGQCLNHPTSSGCPSGWVRGGFYDAGNSSGYGIGWCTKP